MVVSFYIYVYDLKLIYVGVRIRDDLIGKHWLELENVICIYHRLVLKIPFLYAWILYSNVGNYVISTGKCIMAVWHHGSALQPCKCPICRRLITLLVPGEIRREHLGQPQSNQVLRDVEKYNGLFGGGPRSLMQVPHPSLLLLLFLYGCNWDVQSFKKQITRTYKLKIIFGFVNFIK